MDIAFTAKIICDLSLWYCTAGFLLSFFGAKVNIIPFFIMVLCCSVSRALSGKKPAYRLYPLPVLIVSIYFVHSFADILLLIPPLLYCGWLCWSERFSPEYEISIGYYKTSALALLALSVFVLILAGTAPLADTFKYLILFLFSGVFMLRLLRHSEQNRRDLRLQIIDFIILVLCCAAALFLSSQLFLGTSLKVLSVIYMKLIEPLLLALSYLFVMIFWLFIKLLSLLKIGNQANERHPGAKPC